MFKTLMTLMIGIMFVGCSISQENNNMKKTEFLSPSETKLAIKNNIIEEVRENLSKELSLYGEKKDILFNKIETDIGDLKDYKDAVAISVNIIFPYQRIDENENTHLYICRIDNIIYYKRESILKPSLSTLKLFSTYSNDSIKSKSNCFKRFN